MSIPRLFPETCRTSGIKTIQGNQLYGGSATTVTKAPSDDPTNETTILADLRSVTDADATGETVQYQWHSSVDDNVHIVCSFNNTTDDQYSLFTTTDGGTTWAKSLKCGSDGTTGLNGSTWRPFRRMLGDFSICDATLEDGTKAILYAEYNTENVADNRYTSVWVSEDKGLNWVPFWVMTTDSGSSTRVHAHSIYQDPYNQRIIVSIGDDDGTGGVAIVSGPARSSANGYWTAINDIRANNITSTDSDFYVLEGDQKYRVIGLLITENWYYSHTDSETEAAGRGIYRFPKDLSNYTKVYSPDSIDASPIIGGNGIVTQSGKLLFTDFAPAAATTEVIRIHLSEDGVNWYTVAKVILESATTSGRYHISIKQTPDGLIWFAPVTNQAGTTAAQVVAVRETGEWTSDLGAETICPVYWVDQDAPDDTGTGYTPTTTGDSQDAKQTLKALLEGNKITFGGRILLTEGVHETQGITSAWQSNSKTSNQIDENEIVIEGIGKGATLIFDTNNTGAGVVLNSGDGPIKFRNMRVYSNNGSPLLDTTTNSYDGTATKNITEGKIRWR